MRELSSYLKTNTETDWQSTWVLTPEPGDLKTFYDFMICIKFPRTFTTDIARLQSRWKPNELVRIRVVVFLWRRKTGEPEENARSRGENKQTKPQAAQAMNVYSMINVCCCCATLRDGGMVWGAKVTRYQQSGPVVKEVTWLSMVIGRLLWKPPLYKTGGNPGEGGSKASNVQW
jgi:hypothetical protein